jgi:hypothetical protein
VLSRPNCLRLSEDVLNDGWTDDVEIVLTDQMYGSVSQLMQSIEFYLVKRALESYSLQQ